MEWEASQDENPLLVAQVAAVELAELEMELEAVVAPVALVVVQAAAVVALEVPEVVALVEATKEVMKTTTRMMIQISVEKRIPLLSQEENRWQEKSQGRSHACMEDSSLDRD